MNVLVTTLLVGVFAFIGLLAVLSALFMRRVDFKRRLDPQPKQTLAAEAQPLFWRRYLDRIQRLFRPLGKMLPRSPKDLSKQRLRLVQAGFRGRDDVILFYGSQAALVIALLVASAVTGHLHRNPFLCVTVALLLGAALPDGWLSWRIRKRKDRLQVALPDTLDLLVVCVEAGLGLDQSLMRIGQESRQTHPDLSDELRRYHLEVGAGQTRKQALRNLAERSGLSDLKSLVAVLIQTDRFGTSIAQSLRVFSDTLRTKRMQRAEERAAKMAIKMIPPMVLFVFPSIFVVVAGPAVIQIMQHLLPTLSGRN